MEGALWSLYHRETQRFQLTRGMLVSLAMHLLVVGIALILPNLHGRRTVPVSFYSVDLVTMEQAGLKGTGAAAGGGKSKSTPKRAVAKQPASLPVIPVERLKAQPIAEPTAPLKKLDAAPDVQKTVKSSPANLENALDKLTAKPKPAQEPPPARPPVEEKKAAASPSAAGDHDAAEKTEKAAEAKAGRSSGAQQRPVSQGKDAEGGQGGGASQGSGGDPGQIGLARRLYYTEVWNAIRREWALDTSRLKGQQLEAIIILVVRRDGKILSHRFEKKSGHALLDESAERAVRKVDTLPPFPKIYSPSQEEIGIRFRPEDL
jgi:TonB family protein